MKIEVKYLISAVFTLSILTSTASGTLPLSTTTAANDTATGRYGLFNGLDHRSWYSQGDFPEPFIVDDTGLEINEARVDWIHSETKGQRSDEVSAEVEKGFGLLTVELKVPFQRDASPGDTVQGFGNIEVGARYPFYQFVSAKGNFDTTFGAAMEVGIPTDRDISRNTELVPKIYNDTKLGEHFTLQSLFGYSMLLGGHPDGGLNTFEYGFVLGYSIPHNGLPLPGVKQLIPMFELKGELPLNKAAAGHNSLTGLVGVRVNLNALGRVQPRLGVGFIFPVNDEARANAHWGVATSLVFEY